MLTTRREILAGAGALGLSATLPARAMAAADADADAAVEARLDGIADRLLADHPENALQLGIDKGERIALRSRLTDRSAAAEAGRAARARTRLAELKRIDRTPLSPATALDLDVTQAAHELAVAGWDAMPVGDVSVFNTGFRNTPFLVSQLGGAYSDIPDALENRHDVKTSADADAYLSRIEAFATGVDQETARIAADADRGAILPGFLIDITRGQIDGIRTTPVGQWGMIAGFGGKCAAAGLPASYLTRATALTGERVLPALRRQAAGFAALRPRAIEAPGLWARPGGSDWYAWLTRVATTTTRSPDELHAIGLEQNRALSAQIDTLLKGQGLTQGSVGARLAALGRRPDLLFANDDAGRAKLLAYVEGQVAAMRRRLPRAFHTLVPGKLIVKRVPPAIQNGAPNGYAGPGSMDGSQPGIYYINLKDTGIWPRYTLPTLTFHEGIPGHIWQGEYSFRLPLIRSLLAFNAYSEGWALYAEQLGSELGAYEGDPLGQIGFLQSMNFRACRLVVDTGIHARRWTFDQALRWFREGTGMSVAQLTSELQRYCAMPGQACGYKMGHNEIDRLRTKAQATLGPRYDLRAFDDVVVKTGNVPLTLLESVVDRYLAAAR